MAGPTFDDRDGLIWMDGRLVDWRDAKIHVLTHAMHYASSVFEGERAYGGEIFKSSKHSQRLKDSARIQGAGSGEEQSSRRLRAPGRVARLGNDGRLRPE
jgi:branched-subunit amino acid aminotransferase/4-amino-4-deoxychorismate lyase